MPGALFLCDAQGLLSIHGKEHGMVEDTVSALDMLADYNLQVTQGGEKLHGRCCVDRFGVVVAAAVAVVW